MKSTIFILLVISVLSQIISCITPNYLASEQKNHIIDFQDSLEAQITNLDYINRTISQSKKIRTLQDAGIEGEVKILIKVDENGKYLEHQTITSVHDLALKAVLDVIPLMKFSINKTSVGEEKKIWSTTYKFWFKTF